MGLYDEWAYTQEVTITNNTASDLTDFQVAIDLDDTWQGWDNVNADGSDIRFSTQDGGTAIPYWIESWDFTNKTARIWVKVPAIPASGSTTILMHWGKTDAVSESDGSAVFEFFDDFEDGVLSGEWVTSNDVTETNGVLRVQDLQGQTVSIARTSSTYNGNVVLELKLRFHIPSPALTAGFRTATTPVDGAYIYLSSDGLMFETANEGTGTKTDIGTADSEWHRITIKWGEDIKFYYDGVLKATHTTNLPNEPVPIRFAAYGQSGDAGQEIGWVATRKYAEQEPTVTLGALTSKWLTGWSHRNKITINNPNAEDLTDFQVAIDLDDTWDGWLLVKSDGSDIRVTDAGGSTLLPHWIEEFDTTNKTARIWVKVPSIPASGSVDVYLYYGNPDATDASDGSAVFEFFDDFETWEGWTQYQNGQVSQSTAYVKHGSYSLKKSSNGDPNGGYKAIGKTLGRNIVLECWILRESNSGSNADRVGVIDDNGNGYGLYKVDKDDSIGIDKRTNYTGTTYNKKSAVTTNLYWYLMRLKITDTEVITEVDKDDNGNTVATSLSDTDYSTFTNVYVFGGYPYYVDDLRIRKYAANEPTFTIAAREDLQTVYTFYKRVKLILNDDASNEDVELIIDDKFKAFWANRGVELAIVKDGDDTRLLHTINSETTDHISITAHGVTGAKGDVYWLYFDDGQERDTSNLDDTFTPAGLSKTFSIDYILPGEPYVIYDVTFSGFAGKLAESDLTNLTVVDGNTNTVVAHKVVSYEKDGSGAVTSLRLQVRAAYATDTRTFYLYLVGKGQTFDTPDTYIYPVASTGWALLWEKKSVGVSTSILLDGNSFNVTEYDVGYRRNTYHFDIEEGESYNLPSSNYSRVFRLRLVATDDELSTLHTIMKRPYILVDWLGEEFYGQIIELRYRKNARRPMVYDVELTVERVRVV